MENMELFMFDNYESLACVKTNGIIRFVICGFIAASIPSVYHAERIEYRGTSQKTFYEHVVNTYYDFAINDRCLLHIIKTGNANILPYFFEEYPL